MAPLKILWIRALSGSLIRTKRQRVTHRLFVHDRPEHRSKHRIAMPAAKP
jgi:hypothetical protein